VRRDKVALITFAGREARIILQPTASIATATQRLQKITVGGTTPLTQGLYAGLRVIQTERLKDPHLYPLLVLISDGRGNISMYGDEPRVEGQQVATKLGEEGVHVLVIDSARDRVGAGANNRLFTTLTNPLLGEEYMNTCQDLAIRANGEYLGLYDLSQGAILAGVEKSLAGFRAH
jgi:magnesium chelatase subunit D